MRNRWRIQVENTDIRHSRYSGTCQQLRSVKDGLTAHKFRYAKKYFTPLLAESSIGYVQALYEQTQHGLQYTEAYTATGDNNNLPQ